MKKVLVALASAVLMCGCLLGGAACSSEPSPSDVVKDTLEAIKAADSSNESSVLISEFLDSFAVIFDEYNGVSSESAIVTGTTLAEKSADFDYTIDSETIDGDTASVDVTITTYDFGTAVVQGMTEFTDTADEKFPSGEMNESELYDYLFEVFNKQFQSLDTKDVSTTTTLTLTRGDDGWTVDVLSKQNIDALMGGLITAADSLNE